MCQFQVCNRRLLPHGRAVQRPELQEVRGLQNQTQGLRVLQGVPRHGREAEELRQDQLRSRQFPNRFFLQKKIEFEYFPFFSERYLGKSKDQPRGSVFVFFSKETNKSDSTFGLARRGQICSYGDNFATIDAYARHFPEINNQYFQI